MFKNITLFFEEAKRKSELYMYFAFVITQGSRNVELHMMSIFCLHAKKAKKGLIKNGDFSHKGMRYEEHPSGVGHHCILYIL